MTAAPELRDLAPYLAKWGRPTRRARAAVRLASSMAEIQAFHDALLSRLPALVDFLDGFAPDAIPEAYRPLAYAVLALCEVENPIYKWRRPILETDESGSYTAVPLDRMIPKAHEFDSRPARG